MKKALSFFALLLFAATMFAQQIKYSVPVPHTDGTPTGRPNSYSSWIRYDRAAIALYGWAGTEAGWVNLSGDGQISSSGTTVYMTTLTDNFAVGTSTATEKLTVSGNLSLITAGNKINIATGSNASCGTATLVEGQVQVNTTAVTSSSIIFLTRVGTGQSISEGLSYSNIDPGVSFRINALAANGSVYDQDETVVAWWIIN